MCSKIINSFADSMSNFGLNLWSSTYFEVITQRFFSFTFCNCIHNILLLLSLSRHLNNNAGVCYMHLHSAVIDHTQHSCIFFAPTIRDFQASALFPLFRQTEERRERETCWKGMHAKREREREQCRSE